MELLIDAGNSSIKWAELHAGSLGQMSSVLHSGFQEQTCLLDSIWGKLGKPEKILVSNVAGPRFSELLELWVQKKWGCPIEYAKTGVEAFGVINGYTEPERLGVDRWLALIGARVITQDMVVVVDLGTAITIDIMDEQGQHLGGLIVPGLNMMRQALTGRTQGIVLDNEETKFSFPARDTTTAVLAGTFISVSSLVSNTVKEVEGISGKRVQVIITGGDSKIFMQKTGNNYILEQALVLKGLMKMAETKT